MITKHSNRSRRPNILFFQVDQLSATALTAYGNSFCRTPNLDSLAERGVVFETAYCNSPLCAPSRASMAAGQLCSTIGTYDNAAEFPASIPTYAHYLRALGYQAVLSGKTHFIGPDQYHGFEKRLTADIYPTDFSWVPNWSNEGERDTNDARSVTISGVCERSVQIDFDEDVTNQAVQFLYDVARSSDERPFFLQVSYTHPHEPYLCRREFWNLYQDEEISRPVVSALAPDRHDAHSLRLLKDFGMLENAYDEVDLHRARRAYFGSVSYVDSLIGRVLGTLHATGMDGSTVVVFTSDHGDLLGERGMWFKKHFFEPSIKVPLIVTAPWIRPQSVAEFASLVDFLPTFVGLADDGREVAFESLEGVDLTAMIDRGNPAPVRTIHAEYLAESALAPILMVRQGCHKLVWSSADPPLLFDLENDPDELHNLASRSESKEVLSRLVSAVHEKWNDAELTQKIVESQRQRQLIHVAQRKGEGVRWNHGEEPGQTVPWYRGVGGYNAWAFAHLSPTGPDGDHTTNPD